MSRYSNQKKNLNEDVILNALHVYIDISTDLIALQKQLYAQAHLLNRSTFKTFRKIRDSVQDLYGKISNYSSESPAFIKEKQKILQKQIQAMQSNISIEDTQQNTKSQEKGINNQRSDSRSRAFEYSIQRQNQQMTYLSQQIELLKDELRRNDTEYQIQIKKYNVKYEQMASEINYYRQQLDQRAQLEDILDKLQVEIKVLQEVKQRDEQLIQNMAKKIRNLQKERYGMISPTMPSKELHSNGSPRMNTIHSPKSRMYTRLE